MRLLDVITRCRTKYYTRHDLRTGFQRKISCKPLTEKEAELKRLTMTKIMQSQCKVDL